MKKPNFFKTALMFCADSWNNVMDARYNPLRFIRDPSLQAYFTLILFIMWSVYFGFVASYYFNWVNYNTYMSVILHIAVLLPIMATNAVFKDAERDGETWLTNWRDEQRAWKFLKTRAPQKNENVCKWDLEKEG